MQDIETDIRARLKKLGEQLRRAEAKHTLMRPATLDHKVTNEELQTRYKLLLEQINAGLKDTEGHDRHGSDLEYSIRLWLATIDNGSL